MAAAFDALDLDRQRHMLAALISKVTVSRGLPGRRWDPSRVTIDWL
jgi:hypothetical protein